MSGYLPLAPTTAAERSDANALTPIFMGHGQQDNVVDVDRGRASRDALRALGYDVEWHEYPMAHSVCMEEIADLNAWLLKVLAKRLSGCASARRSGFAAEALDQVGDVLVDQFLEFALDHRRDHHLHQAGQGQGDLAVDLELDAGGLLVVLDLPVAADQRVADAFDRRPHHRALGLVADVLAGVDGLDVHLRGAHLFHLPLVDAVAHVGELVDLGEVRHRSGHVGQDLEDFRRPWP